MENSGGIQASLAGRYATALFELARDEKQLEAVGTSLASLRQALAESGDFNALTTSPLVSRDEATRAVAATAKAMKLDPITANFLGVLAQNPEVDYVQLVDESPSGQAGDRSIITTGAGALRDGDLVLPMATGRRGAATCRPTQKDPDCPSGTRKRCEATPGVRSQAVLMPSLRRWTKHYPRPRTLPGPSRISWRRKRVGQRGATTSSLPSPSTRLS